MTPQTVFVQTPLGIEELKTRKTGLANDMRMVLLLIDGRRSVESLVLLSEFLRESTAPLTQLLDGGYITKAREASVSAPIAELTRLQQAHKSSQVAAVAGTRRANLFAVQAVEQATIPIPMKYATAESKASSLAEDETILRAKTDMRLHVRKVMQDDATSICQRIDRCTTRDDLLLLLTKVYDILKNYAGIGEADQLIKRLEYL